jgi:succinoglycan biosynthesis protein ExoV
MRLRYFESKNFGDALNPHLFNKLLPGFFNDNPAIDFIGIGSILGFDMAQTSNLKIVFSSGFAYGTKPIINETFDIVCVRGPYTARALSLDEKLAVADGGILISQMVKDRPKKVYPVSFMPHWESELKFDWATLCGQTGIHYISPMDDYQSVIKRILQSEVIIAEAMHAAIVADALRVPWIPVKAYNGINDFKWNDWASSLDVPYNPIRIPSLFDATQFMLKVCNEKISTRIPDDFYKVGLKGYGLYQNVSRIPQVRRQLTALKRAKSYLSNDDIINSRTNQLLDLLEGVRRKYA